MKIIIFLLCLISICFGSKFEKLSYEGNRQRLNKCGEHLKQSIGDRYSDLWFGRLHKDGFTYSEFGGTLISSRHFIFAHTVINSNGFIMNTDSDNGDDAPYCQDRKLTWISNPKDRFIVDFNLLDKWKEDVGKFNFSESKSYFYGNCTPTKGIVIVELESAVGRLSIPPACIHENEIFGDFYPQQVYASYKHPSEEMFYGGKGMLDTCPNKDSKFCWTPSKYDKFGEKYDVGPVSIPIFRTTKQRMHLIGFGYYWNGKQLLVHESQHFTDALCEHIGVCTEPPTTTTKMTTTTEVTTTTPTATRTTATTTTNTPITRPSDYVPPLLYDEKAMDFEVPYVPKKKKNYGNMISSPINFVVLLILIHLI